MKRTAQPQGLRLTRFENVLDRWRVRELSQWEAAEVLGMGERTFRRWRDRYQGFTLKHFHEHLVKEHGFRYGDTCMHRHEAVPGNAIGGRDRGSPIRFC